MVNRITYFILLPLLFYACSTIRNRKFFAFSEQFTERKIKTKGYYYQVYDLDAQYTKEKGVFIRMTVFLDNGYVYFVKNGFGDQCGDSITLDCAMKMSEYMLDKNMVELHKV